MWFLKSLLFAVFTLAEAREHKAFMSTPIAPEAPVPATDNNLLNEVSKTDAEMNAAEKKVAVLKESDKKAAAAVESEVASIKAKADPEEKKEEKKEESAAPAEDKKEEAAEEKEEEAPADKEETEEEAPEEKAEEAEEEKEEKAAEEEEAKTEDEPAEEEKKEEEPAAEEEKPEEPEMPAYVPPPAPLTPKEKLLEKLEAKEEKLEAEIKDEEAGIAKETESEALAKTMGDIREDIFAVGKKVDLMESDIDDGIKIEEPKSVLDVYPLSSTMKAIINLSIQYFVVFTALAVVRTFNGLMGIGSSNAEKIWSTACDTVAYAPMLCVLFLGARMRALQITQGEGNPQDWCRLAMEMCAWAVLVQTLLVLAIPMFTGEIPETDADGNVKPTKNGNVFLAGILSLIRYTAMLALYGGFSLVCVAVFLMDAETLNAPDKTLWDDPKTEEVELAPPVSPAVSATMNLTLQYFAVYLALALFTSLSQFKPSSTLFKTIENTLHLAKYTVNMAPMLCVLFIGARMRALQIDPVHGSPQSWAQFCFFLCAYSVLVQTCMVLLMPLLGGEAKKGAIEGDVQFTGAPGAGTFLLVCIRYIALLSLYGGFTIVIVSVLIIEAPHGMPTPNVSPAMQCVMNLTIQYFTVYMMLFMAQTFSQLTGRTNVNVLKTLSAALGSVMFCPMLSILFVGTRMRALQLSKQKGSPQCYAQDAMFLATYACLAQLVLTLVLGFLTGPPEVDADGNPVLKSGPSESKWLRYVVETVKWFGLVGIYGGATTVVMSVLTITPQTAFCNPAMAIVPSM